MRASSKRPKVESSGVAPPPPSSTNDTFAEASVDLAAAAAIPPPSTSDDLDIHRMLESIMTVQAVHGQLLVDMLDELRSLCVDLDSLRRSPSPPPFDDEFCLPFGNSSQKGEVHM